MESSAAAATSLKASFPHVNVSNRAFAPTHENEVDTFKHHVGVGDREPGGGKPPRAAAHPRQGASSDRNGRKAKMGGDTSRKNPVVYGMSET
jgi:hypothetical protein